MARRSHLLNATAFLALGASGLAMLGTQTANAQAYCPSAGNWGGTGYCQADSSAHTDLSVANKAPLFSAIKRADEWIAKEKREQAADASLKASQFPVNMKKALAGDAEAQCQVGRAYYREWGVQKDETLAL